MDELWTSTDRDTWEQHFDAVYARIETLKRPDLPDLERWFQEELPAKVADREKKHITGAELAKLMKWKLRRGKWRPRLQALVDELPSDAVVEASTAAFAALAEESAEAEAALRAAVNALTVLKGVGPATASAVLSAGDPAAPFMSDEALAVLGDRAQPLPPAREAVEACGGALPRPVACENPTTRLGGFSGLSSNAYSLRRYVALAAALQARARALSTAERPWTARGVERALFSAAAAVAPPREAARPAAAGAKRKR